MKKMYLVTYEVTFREDYEFLEVIYKANTSYPFYMLTGSVHPDDLYDDTHEDIHRKFGCIIHEETFDKFLPLAHDPKVTNWKEVQP